MKSFFSQQFEDFQTWIIEQGYPKFRAKQVYDWMFKKGEFDFFKMSNLPKDLQTFLDQYFDYPKLEVEKQISKDGTIKFHFTLLDGKSVEAVWMPEAKRKTLCVSSQVGCAMKCQFCVTGLQGFLRNLTVEEIIEQVRYVRHVEGLEVTNLVFMGMGEPLLNFDNLVKAISLLKDDNAFAFGTRKISVSTVGMVPKILPFIEATQVSLAVSLTGSTDETRDHWMPINQKYNLQNLKETLKALPKNMWKKVMFEVVMIGGQTDTQAQAKALIHFLKGLRAKVNLIPYNENEHFPNLKSPKREDLLAFRDTLMRAGYFVSIRKNRGQDIMGACGQLSSHLNQRKSQDLPVSL